MNAGDPVFELRWWMWPLGCGFWLVLVAALASIPTVLHARGFDPGERCSAGETGRCVRLEHGVVVRSDARSGLVTIRFESGSDTVILRDDRPPAVGTGSHGGSRKMA
jgi:hypothetical protein